MSKNIIKCPNCNNVLLYEEEGVHHERGGNKVKAKVESIRCKKCGLISARMEESIDFGLDEML